MVKDSYVGHNGSGSGVTARMKTWTLAFGRIPSILCYIKSQYAREDAFQSPRIQTDSKKRSMITDARLSV